MTDELDRSTGANRFVASGATIAQVMESASETLAHLASFAERANRYLDLGAVTITTKRISNGKISVAVSVDLK